eukprot:gb/GECG01016289.1/.p1 GENE.gb/GECG01016289.1/~~gb/GECG01016289.1/.p1  ORF type:complete len:226 (+),score=46.30 gb/GECG01016289.1/:1-678(+)
MDTSVTYNDGNSAYNFKYKLSDGADGISLNSGYSSISVGEKQEAMQAVNTFLKQRRMASGGAALFHTDQMELLSSQVSQAVLMAQQQNPAATNMAGQQQPGMAMGANAQGQVPPQFLHLLQQQNAMGAPQQSPMGANMQTQFTGNNASNPTQQYQQQHHGSSQYANQGNNAFYTEGGYTQQYPSDVTSEPMASPHNADSTYTDNSQGQTTSSAYQPEEPPPSYQI